MPDAVGTETSPRNMGFRLRVWEAIWGGGGAGDAHFPASKKGEVPYLPTQREIQVFTAPGGITYAPSPLPSTLRLFLNVSSYIV